jgi:uncharacterized protein YqeY
MILLAETAEGQQGELSKDAEMKLLMKAVKQRKESAQMYIANNRLDLAEIEQKEIAIIEKFLPKQLSESELIEKLKAIIQRVGATSAADLGKVMGVATKELAGLADGKAISATAKSLLS